MKVLRAKIALLLDDEAAANKEPARSYKSKKKIILNILEDLAGDNRVSTWVIFALDRLEPDMQRDEVHSFIVDLYKFSNIDFNVIKTNKREWLKDRANYFRICRLRGLYKADLIQKFANLFLRVGLEDTRKDEQQFVFDRLADSLIASEEL